MTQTNRYVAPLPGDGLPLVEEHRRELFIDSAISEDVARERGYETVYRPTANDERPREQLRRLGFPGWAIGENYMYPGLWLPQYTPSGQQYAGQWKPKNAVPGRDGKPQRYASAKGPARLDVHPRWSRDRGGMQLPAIQDPAEMLWITEGVKKADSLTSQGCVTVALAGVFNWRSSHATLGDWEDVRIRGREIVICFDADAITKQPVAEAMARLGKWLRHKGAAKVWYLTVPPMVNGSGVKGVDDYFAAGGTLKELQQAFRTSPPQVTDTEDRFTDARLAETLSNEVLDGRCIWVPGLNWLQHRANAWREVHDVEVAEEVRQWSLQKFADAAANLAAGIGSAGTVDGWRGTLSSGKADNILKRARGVMVHRADELDADLDHLNTPSGYLDLESGLLRALGDGDYPTRVTGARYDPDATSPVWEQFLQRVLPDETVRAFVQRLIGYSLLGEVREHVLPIFTGTGRNGKGTLRDALLAALGDYALEVDPELLMSQHNARHGTFTLELMGRRLVFCSETDKDRKFNESAMKRLVGGDPLQGNRMRCDPITFLPSHTLIMCTNHLPKVSDDPAVWERILVVPFDVVIPPAERDPRLPARLREQDVRDAILAWALEGYRRYMADGLQPPEAVKARTAEYRVESDSLGRFMAEALVMVPSARLKSAEVYGAYLAWIRAEGVHEDPLSKRDLGAALAAKGYPSVKVGGVAYHRGLGLAALTDSEQE